MMIIHFVDILCNCSGTIKDDRIQFVQPVHTAVQAVQTNVQNNRDWYDRLASESVRTVTSDDVEAAATVEGELSSETQQQANDTQEQQ